MPWLARPTSKNTASWELREGWRRSALLTGAAIGDSAKSFRLCADSRMTEEPGKGRLRNTGQTHGLTNRNCRRARKESASIRLQRWTRWRCRLARHHSAMVLSTAPAAWRQFRVGIRREYCRANQREAEKTHQQYYPDAPHATDCTLFSPERVISAGVEPRKWREWPAHWHLPTPIGDSSRGPSGAWTRNLSFTC